MKLTDKMKRFCNEYTIDFNGTQAAIRAGYSKKTANEQASRMLANVNIQQHIKQLQDKLSKKTDITKEKIVAEYAKLAFFDIRKIFTPAGTLKDPKDWDDETASAVAGLENLDIAGKVKSKSIGTLKKVKLSDKRAALDSLCKVLGFNAPEVHKVHVTDLSKLPVTFE